MSVSNEYGAASPVRFLSQPLSSISPSSGGPGDGWGWMADPIRGWLRHMDRRNLARTSIRRRRSIARRFETWLDEHGGGGDLRRVDTETVETWLDTLQVTPQTRGHYIGDLASLFGWMQSARLRDDDPTEAIARPQRPRYLPRPIGTDDLAAAMQAAPPSTRAALALACFAGLRVSEIAGLDVADIDHHGGLLHVRQGKGMRDRVVPLSPLLADELRAYGMPKAGPVIHHDGRNYTPNSLSAKISSYLRGMGVEASAHQLRHWFATQAYQGSGDIRAVQELLGHASLKTTQVYTALSPQAARVAVDSLPNPAA